MHPRGPESASEQAALTQALYASQMAADPQPRSATPIDWVMSPTWAVCRVKFCQTRAVSPLLTGARRALWVSRHMELRMNMRHESRGRLAVPPIAAVSFADKCVRTPGFASR